MRTSASQREHALITTNPVEHAADYLRLAPFREDSRPADDHVQTAAVESLTVDITQQKTVPLHLLMGQEEATQTMNTATNSHRQTRHKQKRQAERQE